jgi:hypothetical protein
MNMKPLFLAAALFSTILIFSLSLSERDRGDGGQ